MALTRSCPSGAPGKHPCDTAKDALLRLLSMQSVFYAWQLHLCGSQVVEVEKQQEEVSGGPLPPLPASWSTSNKMAAAT